MIKPTGEGPHHVTTQTPEAERARTQRIRSRSLSGLKALATRTAVGHALRMVSSLCLARLLVPADYGIFAIAAFLTGLGLYVWDLGLYAALVRQEREPEDDELFTCFCCQQFMTGTFVVALVVAAPALGRLYHLPPGSSVLLRTMALGLILLSLRTAPQMLLERELGFSLIARCELIENVVQTTSTLVLAWLGWGAWALVGGGLMGRATGSVVICAVCPWRPRGSFRPEIVRKLVSFGAPYQLNALVPCLGGGWMPLVVGRLLGPTAVGLVGWASNLAATPLVFNAAFYRVAFPAFSRLHSSPTAFRHYLLAVIRRTSTALWIVMPVVIFFTPLLLPLLFGHRWARAIPLIQWLSLEAIFLTLNGLLSAAQCAAGYPGDRLALTVVIGVARWMLGYALVYRLGLIGAAIALCLVSLCELCISAYLIELRNPYCTGLSMDLIRRLSVGGATLVTALVIGRWVAHHSAVLQNATSVVVFMAATTVRDLSDNERPAASDLRGLLAMLRPVREDGVV